MEHELLGVALVTQLLHALREFPHRLVPGNPLPLALAALADATQRKQDPVGIVHLVDAGQPFGAECAFGPDRVVLGRNLHQFAVLDEAHDRAAGDALDAGTRDRLPLLVGDRREVLASLDERAACHTCVLQQAVAAGGERSAGKSDRSDRTAKLDEFASAGHDRALTIRLGR